MAGQTGDNGQLIDGAACCRRDSFSARVLVLPATCRHGHDLAAVGYRAREAGGIVRVRCAACAAAGASDPFWTLATTEPVANIAELDSTPYQWLVPS